MDQTMVDLVWIVAFLILLLMGVIALFIIVARWLTVDDDHLTNEEFDAAMHRLIDQIMTEERDHD